jgi:hypothetical protein
MDIEKIQPGRRAPMTQQAGLDVLAPKRLAEQRIVLEKDLTDREIVGGGPVPIDLCEETCRERPFRGDTIRR